jgi:VanZ family protein
VLPLSHAKAWRVASIVLVAAVVYASLRPVGPGPDLGHLDKLGHFLAYAVLGAWFGGLAPRNGYGRVALALAVLGLVLEVLQQVMGLGRTGDPNDMVANLAGIAAGLVLAWRRVGGWVLGVEAWLDRR